MFCSIYYRFARVSCYKFVRCLRDLIVIHIRSTCPTGDAQHSFLSYSLSQIIFVLSQNSDKIISWTRRMKLRERERAQTYLRRTENDFIYVIFLKLSNRIDLFQRVNSTCLKPLIRISSHFNPFYFRVLFSLSRSDEKIFLRSYFSSFLGLKQQWEQWRRPEYYNWKSLEIYYYY